MSPEFWIAAIAALPPTLAAVLGYLGNRRSIRRSPGNSPRVPLSKVVARIESKFDALTEDCPHGGVLFLMFIAHVGTLRAGSEQALCGWLERRSQLLTSGDKFACTRSSSRVVVLEQPRHAKLSIMAVDGSANTKRPCH